MDYLLAWYRLIFLIPLAVGMLLVVGVVTGVAEFHHELDLDGDGIPDDLHVGHGHEGHDHDGNSPLLSFLGFGRAAGLWVNKSHPTVQVSLYVAVAQNSVVTFQPIAAADPAKFIVL